jgi:hypothetical protein
MKTRSRKVPGLFQDHIKFQNVVFDDEEFITSDEVDEKDSSIEG